jgi:predicted nucleic acid-binding Zn ribbon protein
MKLNYSSGKKFHNSAFHPENFRKLKKDEQKQKAFLNLFYLILLLAAEYIVLSLFTRY